MSKTDINAATSEVLAPAAKGTDGIDPSPKIDSSLDSSHRLLAEVTSYLSPAAHAVEAAVTKAINYALPKVELIMDVDGQNAIGKTGMSNLPDNSDGAHRSAKNEVFNPQGDPAIERFPDTKVYGMGGTVSTEFLNNPTHAEAIPPGIRSGIIDSSPKYLPAGEQAPMAIDYTPASEVEGPPSQHNFRKSRITDNPINSSKRTPDTPTDTPTDRPWYEILRDGGLGTRGYE